ncbi:hypothetical protein FJ934_03005 [Mesorhizobium sp. B2-4-12]|nr:hypothetical protein FJ934_03005 [Mesorhizobium sp. B2-4-12]
MSQQQDSFISATHGSPNVEADRRRVIEPVRAPRRWPRVIGARRPSMADQSRSLAFRIGAGTRLEFKNQDVTFPAAYKADKSFAHVSGNFDGAGTEIDGIFRSQSVLPGLGETSTHPQASVCDANCAKAGSSFTSSGSCHVHSVPQPGTLGRRARRLLIPGEEFELVGIGDPDPASTTLALIPRNTLKPATVLYECETAFGTLECHFASQQCCGERHPSSHTMLKIFVDLVRRLAGRRAKCCDRPYWMTLTILRVPGSTTTVRLSITV